jgi:tetratricopeptide (TPR) repeat protein
MLFKPLDSGLTGFGGPRQIAEHFRQAVIARPDDAALHAHLGSALRKLGRTEGALEHLRRAVSLDPGLAFAQADLAQYLLDLGRRDEAAPHCHKAVALDSRMPDALINRGNLHRLLGRHREAVQSYLDALSHNLGLARAHANLGHAYHAIGQIDTAFTCFRRAIEFEPDSVELLGFLADLAADWDRQAEAIACYERMLAIDSGRALTHTNLGLLFTDEGQLDQAERCFTSALEVEPSFALAEIGMGGLLETKGELAGAEARYRHALELHPGHTVALHRLAVLARGKLPDRDLDLLRRRLADRTLDDGRRSSLLFGLAQVLDGRERFDEAAKCLETANALALADLERRHRAFQPAEHERFISDMIDVFQPEIFERFAGHGLDSRRPVFVFGFPRSGTTLIEQILASHPQVKGAGELRLAREDFAAIPSLVNPALDPFACVRELNPAMIAELARRHDERLAEIGGQASQVVNKMPDNYMYLGLLSVLFPRATFIHCRRDARDTAVSCWINSFQGINWCNDPRHIGARFAQYRRIMSHWRNALPATIHHIDYEHTVANLEDAARGIVAACGLDWDPTCLAFHANRRPVRTASVTQVRRPVYNTSVGRWKNYEHSLVDLLAALPRDNSNQR